MDAARDRSNSDGEPSGSAGDISQSRKRRRRRTTAEPSSVNPPPLKRQRATFNPKYLSLLNEDITDAASGVARGFSGDGDDYVLGDTQVGAVTWTAAEKRTFFSALGRLGRDDAPAIAARIGGSKSALEVRQYLVLLSEAERVRREDHDENGGRRHKAAIRPVDVPAAVEVGAELCVALEEAADGVALRQEAHEAAVEQKRWAGRWLITPPLAQVLDRQHHQHQREQQGVSSNDLPPFAELFPLRSWLQLSERVFMNSSVADGNWRSVSQEDPVPVPVPESQPPSIRATALADFHALALSVTRRLVAAALFVAGSRLRAKQAGDRRKSRTSAVVKAKDVQAAAASVGLKENNREFWARAARRLRLDVYDDKDEEYGAGSAAAAITIDDTTDEEDVSEGESTGADTIAEGDYGSEYEDSEEDNTGGDEAYDNDNDDNVQEPNTTLSYDEIEAALGFSGPNHRAGATGAKPSYAELPDVSSSSSEAEFTDDEELRGEGDVRVDTGDEVHSDSEDDEIDLAAVMDADLDEAAIYSAHDRAGTTRARQAIQRWHAVQARLEADADRLDRLASAHEEARLWNVLRQGDTSGTGVKTESESEPVPKPSRKSGLVDLEGRNWRDHTEYYSEWEVLAADRIT
ncbi:hypothetical protein AAE478_001826 [Parahypoxylon ruwenzoriense]